MELLGLEGVQALRSLNTPLFKQKVTAMFYRKLPVIAAALVAATPLFALIEDETAIVLETQETGVVQTHMRRSLAQVLFAANR